MKKRFVAIGLASVLCVAMAATACSSGTAETTTEATTAEETTEAETTISLEGTFTGTVTDVSDDKITIETEDYGKLTFTITDETDVNVSGQTGGASGGDMGTPPDGFGGGSMGTPPDGQGGGDSQAADPGAQAAGGSGDSETPPAKPDGDTGSDAGQGGGDSQAADPGTQAAGGSDSETPPAKPDGDTGSDAGQGGDSQAADPGAQAAGGSGDSQETDPLDSLEEGVEATITSDAEGNALTIEMTISMSMGGQGGQGGQPGGQPGGMGGGSANIEYTAVNTYTEDTTISNESFESTGTDENAILVDGGATVTLEDITVSRKSSSSSGGDNASFYGVGASILAKDGTAIISDAKIESDASGGAGVFAYGDGIVYISDSTINTNQSSSGGIHVAGGGTLYAEELNITTNGGSAAAIRSDRGGGTMVVDEGSYTSNGSGSPAIYCTADITVNEADLTANGSEAICIEGLNSIRLFDCNLTGNMQENSQNDCTWNVILYQSMSGDSEVGNSTFEMVGGTLTAKNGGMFYTTNTESTFILSGVTINNSADNPFILKCTGNANQRGWGTTGKNGAECTFTAVDQVLEGDVIWDSISTLDMYLTDGSTLTGAFVNDESCAGTGGEGYADLYISKDSTWVVTGNSTLTNLYTEGTIKDASGNTVTIQGTDGTVFVQGTGSVTITVSTYTASAYLEGASVVESFETYEVEMP